MCVRTTGVLLLCGDLHEFIVGNGIQVLLVVPSKFASAAGSTTILNISR
jgi:hypothetical protein